MRVMLGEVYPLGEKQLLKSYKFRRYGWIEITWGFGLLTIDWVRDVPWIKRIVTVWY